MALFVLGVALVARPLNSPLETIAVHYLLVDPPAPERDDRRLGAAAPRPRADPRDARPRRARAAAGRSRCSRGRAWRCPLWLAVWYGVHLPLFYDWALRTRWPLNLEHGAADRSPASSSGGRCSPTRRSTLSTPSASPTSASRSSARRSSRSRYIFSARAFYGFYEEAPRLWGLSPSKDQNLGGILMNGEQLVVFFAALSYFLLQAAERGRGGAAGPGGPVRRAALVLLVALALPCPQARGRTATPPATRC